MSAVDDDAGSGIGVGVAKDLNSPGVVFGKPGRSAWDRRYATRGRARGALPWVETHGYAWDRRYATRGTRVDLTLRAFGMVTLPL